MASRNYLVMTTDMSLSDRKDYRQTALAAGIERCGNKDIGSPEADIPGLEAIPKAELGKRIALIKNFIATGNWPRTIDARELAPLTDLVVAAAQDSWLTAAFAAVGTAYTCLNAVAAPQLNQGMLLVCYGVSVESAAVPMPASRLIFRRGGAAGNIQAQFDMEPMGVRMEPDAFFSEVVIFEPRQTFAIQALCRNATGAGVRIHVHNFLFEESGDVIA
jgi:hypothetical protein